MISLFRIIKMGIQDFWRNIWLSFATISVITFTLIIVSSLFILNLTIQAAGENIRQKMDVAISLKDPIDVLDILSFKVALKNISKNDQKNYTFEYDLSDILPYASVVENGGGQIKDNKIIFSNLNIPANKEVNFIFKLKIEPKNKWPSSTILPNLKERLAPDGFEMTTVVLNETKNIEVFSASDVQKRKNPFLGELVFLLGERYFNVIELMKESLKNTSEVKDIKYISKKEALDRFKKEHPEQHFLIEYATLKNPLPASLEIKVKNPEKTEEIQGIVEKTEFQSVIKEVSWEQERNKKIAQKLLSLSKYVKTFGIFLSVFFFAISLLIIINTIKINLFARRESIEIMKLVGASPLFIKGPFFVESLIYGFFSAVISFVLLYPVLTIYILPRFVNYVGEGGIEISQLFSSNLLIIFALQVLLGLFIGGLSSLLAIRKYLKRY